jgi:hypothetical protein
MVLSFSCFTAGCGKDFLSITPSDSDKPKETTTVSYVTGIVVSQGAHIEGTISRGYTVHDAPVVLININGKVFDVDVSDRDTYLGTYALKQGDKIRVKKTVITITPRGNMPSIYPKVWYTVSAPRPTP